MLLILMLKKGPETGCYLAGPPSPARAVQSGTHSNLKRTLTQETLDKPGEMTSETKIPEVHQNAVLPGCVIGLLTVKENSYA